MDRPHGFTPQFRVERSAVIKASPENIFPLIADFHQWGRWSPYETRDPAMKRTYGGADSQHVEDFRSQAQDDVSRLRSQSEPDADLAPVLHYRVIKDAV